MEKYKDTLKWMFSKLPMYQRKGASAYRPGLDTMNQLDEYLGHPHRAFKSIHIAGTNGKGSTAHIMASILQSKGLKTGLYTSPHMLDFRERIKVNGVKIPKAKVAEFVSKNKNYFETKGVSFFEMTVSLAFWYFKKAKVDYAIIEVGLGGRLDATNIIMPVLSVITNIGLDHTQFLGETHAQIAQEKAGIIKKGVPIVIGEKEIKTKNVFIKTAQKVNAPLYFVEKYSSNFNSDLQGIYHSKNIQTAVTALKYLDEVELSLSSIQKGLLNVVINTQLMGRWQIISKSPEIILDVAHNKEGLTEVIKQLKMHSYQKLHLIMGFTKGRDIKDLLSLFPMDAAYYLSSPAIERAVPLTYLKEILKYSFLNLSFGENIIKVYKKALSNASPEDLILVTGSTFVVSEVLANFKNEIFE